LPTCGQCGHDHDIIRQACRESLFATCKLLCGFTSPPYEAEPSENLHLKICTWLEDRIRQGHRRLLVMIPRGHLKTHVITIGGTIWFHINNPQYRIFVMHNSSTLAEGMIGNIQSIIMGKPFGHYFPECVPQLNRRLENGKKPRWSEREIELPRDRYHPQATITALGLETTIESSHVHVIILDDLVVSKTAQSPSLMERAMNFRRTIGPLFEHPQLGLLIVVGTYWPGGFYEELIEDSNFEKLILGCYQDSRSATIGMTDIGQPLWSERFTLEHLADEESASGSYVFAHQYRNDPISKGAAKFRAEDLRYFEETPGREVRFFDDHLRTWTAVPISELHITQTADPAGETGDDSAITTLGYHYPTNSIFLLDHFSEPCPARTGALRYVKMAKKWNPKDDGIEKGAFQLVWKPFLSQYMKEKGIKLKLVELQHGGESKSSRIIEGFQPFVENHRFFMRKRDIVVAQEMIRWNPERKNQKDNLLDSLAYHVQLWRFRRPKRAEKTKDGIPIDEDKQRRHIQSRGRIYGLGKSRRVHAV